MIIYISVVNKMNQLSLRDKVVAVENDSDNANHMKM